MASVPRTIRVVPVTEGQTLTYEIPAGVAQFIQAVYAEIDATGSSDTTPVLSIQEQAGVPIAFIEQDEAVTGGDTGRATWALRLAGSSSGNGIQFDVVPQVGNFLDIETTGSFNDGFRDLGIRLEAVKEIDISTPDFFRLIGGLIRVLSSTDLLLSAYNGANQILMGATGTVAGSTGGGWTLQLHTGQSSIVTNNSSGQIFRIDENGDLHGKTGASLVFDL